MVSRKNCVMFIFCLVFKQAEAEKCFKEGFVRHEMHNVALCVCVCVCMTLENQRPFSPTSSLPGVRREHDTIMVYTIAALGCIRDKYLGRYTILTKGMVALQNGHDCSAATLKTLGKDLNVKTTEDSAQRL